MILDNLGQSISGFLPLMREATFGVAYPAAGNGIAQCL